MEADNAKEYPLSMSERPYCSFHVKCNTEDAQISIILVRKCAKYIFLKLFEPFLSCVWMCLAFMLRSGT